MEARLALIPEAEDGLSGTVKPVTISNGSIYYGLSVGGWVVSSVDGYIHITLIRSIDTIIHELATREGVRAESRAMKKDAKGIEKKPVIEYDTKTKRFRQV